MALETFVTNLEDVGESLRAEYEQVEGGFSLKILSGFVAKDKVENVDGLKSALHKERENARTASKRARELEDQFGGFDPDELSKLRTEKAQAEEDRAKKAGEWDTLKVQLVTQHQSETKTLREENSSLKKAYDDQLIDTAVVTAIAGEKGNTTLLSPHVRNHVQVVKDEAGKFSVQVVDDAGTPRVNGSGQFIGVSDLVKEMRDQDTFAGAFVGTQSSGGGTPPGGGGGGGGGGKGGTPSDLKRSSMTPRQKVDFIRKFSDADYQNLPA